MSPKRKPLSAWTVAGGLIAAVLVALETVGGAVSTLHEILVWMNERLGLGEDSPLLSREASIIVLLVLLGAVLLGLFKWIVSRLVAPTRDRVSRRGQTKEERTRAAYLDYLEADVKGRLAASIHRARFLDLGMDEAQGATLPWHYVHHNPDAEAQVFTSIDQAFDGFKRRLLLLGSPGAGKSTTLLHLARRLLEEAKNNPEAPVPVLLNLSSYKGPAPKRRFPFLEDRREDRNPEEITAFDQWLVQQFEGLPVRDIRKLARSWIEERKIALLLDGVDEVAESRVSDLIRDLNQSFFSRHPDLPTVICSRIFEYQRIAEDREMRLRLQGAVMLQPLTPEQVDLYLTTAQAEGLRDALLGDAELRELARTPLTLSMMVLAYGGLAPTEIPTNLPLVERRRHLFDIYVARMLQRKERRDRGVPFDLNPEMDVPLTYSIDQVNRYLGWLAVRLSERSLTGFLPHSLMGLLRKGRHLRHHEPVWTSLRLAQGLFVLLLSFATAAVLFTLGNASLWLVVPFGLLGGFVYALFAYLERPGQGWLAKGIVGSGASGLLALILGLTANALITLSPWPLPSFWTAIFIPLGTMLLLLFTSTSTSEQKGWLPSALWGLVPALLFFILIMVLGRIELALWTPLVGMLAAIYMFFYVEVSEGDWLVLTPTFLAISVVTVVLVHAAMWLIGEPDPIWGTGLTVSVLGVLAIPGIGETTVLIGLAIGAAIGMVIGGAAVLPFAAIALAVAAGKVSQSMDPIVERYLLNPCLLAVLIFQRRAPLEFLRFLDYLVEALLLKNSGREYEFIHRLLRDHFAVRELIPLLKERLSSEVIERLSLQGEASLDSLSDLTTHPNVAIRRAAVAGLGRLTTPAAVPLLTRVLTVETVTEVRAEAVMALGRFPGDEMLPLLKDAMIDDDPEIRAAVMTAVGLLPRLWNNQMNELFYSGLTDDDDQVLQAAVMMLERAPSFYRAQFEITSRSFSDKLQKVLGRIRLLLDHPDPNVRSAALVVVGLIRDRGAVPKVLKATCERNSLLRLTALEALGRIGGPESLSTLRAALKSWSVRTRATAAMALGNALSADGGESLEGDRDVVLRDLSRACRDRSKRVRLVATQALRANRIGMKHTVSEPFE